MRTIGERVGISVDAIIDTVVNIGRAVLSIGVIIITTPLMVFLDYPPRKPLLWRFRPKAYQKYLAGVREREEADRRFREQEKTRQEARRRDIEAGNIIEVILNPGVPATVFKDRERERDITVLAVDTLTMHSEDVLSRLRSALSHRGLASWAGEGLLLVKTDFPVPLELMIFLGAHGMQYRKLHPGEKQHWTLDEFGHL